MKSKVPPPKTARILIAACAAAVLMKVFLIDLMIADGRSMLPTIRPGTVLPVLRAAYGLRNPFGNGYLIRWGSPTLGDIIVFTSPDGQLAVKRYLESFGDGSFMAVGDNRSESYDSRNYGPIAVDSILGKVIGMK